MKVFLKAVSIMAAAVMLMSFGTWKDAFLQAGETQVSDSLGMRGAVKVVVLPFDIRTLDVSVDTSMMRQETQEICIKAIAHQNRDAQVLDQEMIHEVLASKGVGLHLAKYVNPSVIASWLGADYVVFGVSDISKKYLPVSGFTSSDSVFVVENKQGDKEEDAKNNNHSFGSQTAYMRMVYSTKVSLTIYNKAGDEVFSSSRRGVGQGIYAYHGAIKYITKRSPFNKRYARRAMAQSKKP